MKTQLSLILTAFLMIFTFAPTTFAQDYTQVNLPEGAKVRLGKGSIYEIAYSPDGARLAVASSIGIWLYDTQTYQEIALQEIAGSQGIRVGSIVLRLVLMAARSQVGVMTAPSVCGMWRRAYGTHDGRSAPSQGI